MLANGHMLPDAELGLFAASLDTSPTASCSAVSSADYEKFMAQKEESDPKDKLPPEYHSLADAFTTKDTDVCPPHREGIDHVIKLKEGAEAPHKRPYPMSERENAAIKEWIDKQEEKGMIQRSQSEFAAPVIVVRKPGGGLRICVDYRALNEITVKSRYPIPLVRETMTLLEGKKYFTKLDITAAFNRIRMAEDSVRMTAFTTRFGQFECLAMPFGLCNAPATF